MLYEEKQIETIPVGPLGLIPLKSCETLGKKVDAWLTGWRNERESEHKSTIAFAGYQRDSYIVGARTPRFGSGGARARSWNPSAATIFISWWTCVITA